ncbi:MAG: TldD/PmbA family protein [Erysipelotrichales bacterium]|nr:TldD/PmbA family protein [Erysipelotrichales bacterium]
MNFKDLIKKAKAAGLTDLEIYHQKTKSFSLTFFDGQMDNVNNNNTDAAAFRCLYNGKMGYVSSENLAEEKADFIIKRLKDNASIISSDEKTIIFPGSKDYEKVNEEYDDFTKVPVADKMNLIKQISNLAFSLDKRVSHFQVRYSESEVSVNLLNSLGLNLEKHYSFATISAQLVVKDGEESKSDYDYKIVKKFKDFKPEDFAKDLVATTLKRLAAGKVKTGKYNVIFENKTFASFLQAISGIFSGEAVMRSLSCLKDKLNTKIGSEVVNFIDNPLFKEANFIQTFDDEGVATKNKTLVEKGVLKTYHHSLKSAAHFNLESTGNGFKRSIDAAVAVLPHNFYLDKGKDSVEELAEKCGNGIYITELNGLHSGISMVSGSFSLQSSGFLIENGKITEPVTLFVTSGNIIELFQAIKAVGNDLSFNFGHIGSPSVLVENISIAGE